MSKIINSRNREVYVKSKWVGGEKRNITSDVQISISFHSLLGKFRWPRDTYTCVRSTGFLRPTHVMLNFQYQKAASYTKTTQAKKNQQHTCSKLKFGDKYKFLS